MVRPSGPSGTAASWQHRYGELITCMANQPQQILIGRQAEMATLTAALDDAMAGHGRLVMLAGEPQRLNALLKGLRP